jgi:hypothetical protein
MSGGENGSVRAPPAQGWLLPDDITPEDLAEILAEAEQVLAAVLWPCPMPVAPFPAPIDVAVNIIASRLYVFGKAGEGQALVSESLGSYTYRLANPLDAEAAALVPAAVYELVEPWACRKTVYDVGTYPSSSTPATPVAVADYFEHDLDNELAAADAAELEASS